MASKTLRSGISIPSFGLGMWLQSQQDAANTVLTAIRHGYRLFDCAMLYENERQLGEALRKSNLKRNEYFVVTKLRSEYHGYNEARQGLEASLEKLGLDYVDLFLIHSPKGGKNIETWKSLTELCQQGKTRSIGVSNFNVKHLEALEAAGLPIPAVNQIELHPWIQQREVVDYCHKKNIALMAFCPLARCRMFEDGACEVLSQLARKYQKTKAQILIKWSLQKGFICIPKSSNEGRIKENIDVFDFTLIDDDINALDSLDCNMAVSIITEETINKAWEG